MFLLLVSILTNFSALSSQNFGATTFCINMMPHDFSDKLITVSKTGESFILDIEGLEQNEENFFCKSVILWFVVSSLF